MDEKIEGQNRRDRLVIAICGGVLLCVFGFMRCDYLAQNPRHTEAGLKLIAERDRDSQTAQEPSEENVRDSQTAQVSPDENVPPSRREPTPEELRLINVIISKNWWLDEEASPWWGASGFKEMGLVGFPNAFLMYFDKETGRLVVNGDFCNPPGEGGVAFQGNIMYCRFSNNRDAAFRVFIRDENHIGLQDPSSRDPSVYWYWSPGR